MRTYLLTQLRPSFFVRFALPSLLLAAASCGSDTDDASPTTSAPGASATGTPAATPAAGGSSAMSPGTVAVAGGPSTTPPTPVDMPNPVDMPGTPGTPMADAGTDGGGAGPGPGPVVPLENFSFFVTSLEGLQRLSGNPEGFGGDLRYGTDDGLSGADKICAELAENSMPGSAAKEWHAFLSVSAGPNGQPVHAIDRVGDGPWYDRLGRVVAMTKEDLLQTRPRNADPAIINDLPNEFGVPNKRPDPAEGELDNHHILTGSDEDGELYGEGSESTCKDWTSAEGDIGRPRTGFSWPRDRGGSNGQHWMTTHDEAGCAVGINLIQSGGPPDGADSVGAGGGYGGIYCFALTP